jgi:hypothetical protein
MSWGNSHKKAQKTHRVLKTLCVFCAFLWLFSLRGFGQQRPLLTETPRLIPNGAVVTELGFGYFQDAKFPLTGLRGDQYSFLVNGMNFGLGPRAEFQISGVAQHLVRVKDGGSGWRNDWGDVSLSTKIKIVEETPVLPIVSFRPSVLLPNGNDARGISLNSTQFFGSFLVGKTVGPAFIFGNAGLGILTDTVRLRAQEDVLVYGLAAVLPINARLSLLTEWNGRKNPESGPSPGLESRGEVRLGLRFLAGGLHWDVGATAGLTRLDPRRGVVFGMTKEFQLWK